MTIEEAIARFEKRNFWLNANPRCQRVPERVKRQADEIERNNIAIKALKEQQKRNKGCPVCHPNNRDYHFGGKLPKFCPHCGKQLKEVQPCD